jgi:Uncharacterized conserved protein
MSRYKKSCYKKILLVLSLILLTIAISGCFNKSNSESKTGIKEQQDSTSQTDKGKENSNSNSDKMKEEANSKNTKIKIRIMDKELIAVMEDNPTTKDFLNMLPLTMSFKDFSGAEKISYPPNKLSTEKAPEGYTPKKGDIACYSPWGNIAVFYKDREYASGLIYMGHIESGMEVIEGLNADFNGEVTIEK